MGRIPLGEYSGAFPEIGVGFFPGFGRHAHGGAYGVEAGFGAYDDVVTGVVGLRGGLDFLHGVRRGHDEERHVLCSGCYLVHPLGAAGVFQNCFDASADISEGRYMTGANLYHGNQKQARRDLSGVGTHFGVESGDEIDGGKNQVGLLFGNVVESLRDLGVGGIRLADFFHGVDGIEAIDPPGFVGAGEGG